jgi:hypothetical protein
MAPLCPRFAGLRNIRYHSGRYNVLCSKYLPKIDYDQIKFHPSIPALNLQPDPKALPIAADNAARVTLQVQAAKERDSDHVEKRGKQSHKASEIATA